ncbi:MAG: LamG-like jellyroll fold domain-containing protein, partial [Oscillospiraceae bacterium]
SALEQLKAKTNNKLDAIFVAGDLTDNGNVAQAQQFKKVYESVLGQDPTKLIYALGNHDSSGGSNAKLFADTLGQSFFETDIDKDQINNGNRFVEVNGYYFISVEVQGYGGAEKCYYSAATKDWLSKKLEFCNNQNPNKPIFVATHAMIYDTAYGSTLPGDGPAWYTKQLTPILSKYPQAVTFSGHVHHPLNDERSIMQTAFTSLGCGSVSYMAIESGYTDEPTPTSTVPVDASQTSQGLLVQIDKSNNMKVTRMDFYNNREIGKPWIIPAPNANGDHLKYYGKDRADRNDAPVFDSNTKFDVAIQNGNEIKISTGIAKDDEMVHHYRAEVKLKNSDDKPAVLKTLSGFYRTTMPTSFNYTFKKLYLGATYEVKVYAVDSWGAESIPLTKDILVPDSTIVPEKFIPDIFNLEFDDNGKDTSVNNYALKTGSKTSIVTQKDFERKAYSFDGTIDSPVSFIMSDTNTTNLLDNFTADIVFKATSFKNEDQHIVSNNITGGFAFMIPADSKKLSFYLMVNNQKKYLETKEDIVLGQYYRASVVYDGSQLILYLNGEEQSVMSQSGSLLKPKGNQNYLAIGAKPSKTGEYSNVFNGCVSIVRLFGNVLDRTHVRALPTPELPKFEEVKYEIGDVNRDGKLNTLDPLAVLKHVAEMERLDEEQLILADYNKDSKVNTLDALAMLKKIVNA